MTNYINAKWVPGTGEKFQSTNPANNELLYEANEATEAEVDAAVLAARAAFSDWSELKLDERLKYLENFVELLTQNRGYLSELISKEVGKPLWESNAELGAMINKLKISVQAYHERTGIKENPNPLGQSAIRHKAHGVLAVYGPYNFPGHLPNGHIIPALLAGNTVVFKPSNLTPLVADAIVKLWDETKIPKGVINLVQGASRTGIALSKHKQIDGILFTGSSQTGRLIHKELAGQAQKILALEMGGNNPLIVNSVSDFKAVAYTIIQSAFITSGQRCTCARRLIMPKGNEANEILSYLIEMSSKLKIGNYDEDVFMGPVISKEQALNLMNEQKKLLDKGAKALLEMKIIKENTGFISPGIIDSTGIEGEDFEIFGPLLQLKLVDDFDAAIKEANNTAYGLSAGLLSDDKNLYDKFYKKIRAGIVNWNNQLTGASSSAPFGGIGLSGNHRASAYYAADYCSYPVASLEANSIKLPEQLSPGIEIQ